jgi:threonine/homoserine efflux transporter RhtA
MEAMPRFLFAWHRITVALALAGLVIALDEHDQTTALDLFGRALSISNANAFRA